MLQPLDEFGTEAADGLSDDDVPSLDGLLGAGRTDFQLCRLLILVLGVVHRGAWCSRCVFSKSNSTLGAGKSESLFKVFDRYPPRSLDLIGSRTICGRGLSLC